MSKVFIGMPPFFNKRYMPLLRPCLAVLVLLSLLLSPLAQASISQSVRLPNQEYSESSEDLKVKVLGGHVRINRSWVAGQWYLNPAWANLRFQPDPLGGVLAIDRAGSMYTRLAGGTDTDVYAFGPDNFIARQESGWRWYDRLGNSVTYDVQGRILSYTDVAGISVHFVYGSNGVLKEVQDHHGQPALTLTSDEQGRVTQVSDAREPGRSVHYRWSGNGPASLLSEVTDVLGHRWLYEYNSNGQITQRTDPLGATVKLTYMSNPKPIPSSPGFAGMGAGDSNPDGTPIQVGSGSTKVSGPPIARVASYTNEAGATTHYRVEWDRTRQQYTLHSQEPNGLERTTVYDKDGRVLRSRAGGLVNTQRSVDSATQERMTDARGQVTIYQYNSARQPVRIIHPDGSSERFSYDSHGRKTEHTNTLGIISRWEYNAQGRETLHTEAVGQPEQRSTRSTYDGHGQLISQTLGAGDATGSDAVTYTFAYDAYGNRIKTTDPLGHTTQLSYNSQGLPVQQTDALNNVSRYSYDAAGNLLTATNALNETATHTYDARGRKIKSVSAEGLEQISHYDSAGHLIELRAPGQDKGHGTRIQYDSMGRPTQTTSPSGLISTTEFDQLGRMVKTTDPAGNAITYTYGDADSPLAGLLTAVQYPTYKETYQYDQRGRQTAITQHLGDTVTRTQHQSHDAMGQVVSSTDPAGRTTLYQYDRLGRLTQITDPLAQTTQHSWDAHDNLLSLTDAAGNTHRFAYSKVGQLLKETRPLGGAIQYRYNAAGYLTQRIDAANNTRTYRYDAAGRLIEEEHTLPNGTRDQLSQYAYNKDGQLTGYEQTDGSNQLISSATYDLDEQGRTKTGTTTYGKIGTTDSVSFTTGQSFNADGQLDSHTYPDGSQQKYSYHHGQLNSITLPNQSEISYDSYKWVMPTRISGPGTHKDITYDALLRPTGITVKNQQTPGQTLAQRLYQYDTSGNISQIQSELGITDYGYDKLDRLTQASPDTALQALGLPQEQYGYDPVGNRTSSAHQPGFWRYNADNQLTEYPSLKPFSLGALPVDTDVSYTPHGHTEKETNRIGTKEYGYNAAERLIRFANTLQGQTTPQLEAQYRYDPFGRRIAKTITQGSQTGTVWFIYNEQGLLAEANEQGELTKAYGFNPTTGQQGLWSTDPIWQANIAENQLTSEHTRYHYLHTDHLYTPMLATDATGEISWKAVQEAFGAVSALQHQSRINMNLRFPGQYYDQETGTHYNFHRDYKPNVGRYVQSDPIGLRGDINNYGYTLANPLSLIDFDGMRAQAARAPSSHSWKNNNTNQRYGGPGQSKGSSGGRSNSGSKNNARSSSGASEYNPWSDFSEVFTYTPCLTKAVQMAKRLMFVFDSYLYQVPNTCLAKCEVCFTYSEVLGGGPCPTSASMNCPASSVAVGSGISLVCFPMEAMGLKDTGICTAECPL